MRFDPANNDLLLHDFSSFLGSNSDFFYCIQIGKVKHGDG